MLDLRQFEQALSSCRQALQQLIQQRKAVHELPLIADISKSINSAAAAGPSAAAGRCGLWHRPAQLVACHPPAAGPLHAPPAGARPETAGGHPLPCHVEVQASVFLTCFGAARLQSLQAVFARHLVEHECCVAHVSNPDHIRVT